MGERLEDYFGSTDEPAKEARPKKAPAEKPQKLPPEPWRSSKPPEVQDSAGRIITRVGYAGIRRSLDDPIETVTGKAPDYMAVFCCGLGISISRDGARAPSATFTLWAEYPAYKLSLKGPEGRDELIKRFLTIWKKRKSFAMPASACKIDEAPRVEHPWAEKRRKARERRRKQ